MLLCHWIFPKLLFRLKVVEFEVTTGEVVAEQTLKLPPLMDPPIAFSNFRRGRKRE